ncbi:hypothetical protein L7F22_015871 [Adiantum nelumboides]|nr:hypothetical protein [Adiantum nelumboides]
MDLFAGTGTTTVSTLKRGRNVVDVECDPPQVRFIEQRFTALKELPDEFQEVGMKSMASDPRFFNASREPQPPIGSKKVGEIVDLVDFEPNNVEVEEQVGDSPLQITSLGEEMRKKNFLFKNSFLTFKLIELYYSQKLGFICEEPHFDLWFLLYAHFFLILSLLGM